MRSTTKNKANVTIAKRFNTICHSIYKRNIVYTRANMNRANALIGKAYDLENKGHLHASYQAFENGIALLMILLKHERHPMMKDILSKRVDRYLQHAEKVKEKLKENDSTTTPPQAKGTSSPDPEVVFTPIECSTEWDEVIGMENAKSSILEATLLPQKFPHLFAHAKPWRAILLFGPGGTGKTLLASAVAKKSGSKFFSVSSSDIISKWQGESEKTVRMLFESARNHAPSIIFIDEIDSMSSARGDDENDSTRRIKTELLIQMQGISENKNVLVIGATNTPWALDAAFRRRFEKRIFVGLPNKSQRLQMLSQMLPSEVSQDRLAFIAGNTKGFSGADLSVLCREMTLAPLRSLSLTNLWTINENKSIIPLSKRPPCNNHEIPFCENCLVLEQSLIEIDDEAKQNIVFPDIDMEMIETALENVKPSTSDKELKRFVQWAKEFASE